VGLGVGVVVKVGEGGTVGVPVGVDVGTEVRDGGTDVGVVVCGTGDGVGVVGAMEPGVALATSDIVAGPSQNRSQSCHRRMR
jgi:hypothetical protein